MNQEKKTSEKNSVESTLQRGERGLTLRSALAILYGGWIMLPVVLYISLGSETMRIPSL